MPPYGTDCSHKESLAAPLGSDFGLPDASRREPPSGLFVGCWSLPPASVSFGEDTSRSTVDGLAGNRWGLACGAWLRQTGSVRRAREVDI